MTIERALTANLHLHSGEIQPFACDTVDGAFPPELDGSQFALPNAKLVWTFYLGGEQNQGGESAEYYLEFQDPARLGIGNLQTCWVGDTA